jgi:hypothetical protein
MRSIANVLPYIQIGLSIILIGLVLLQQSDADLGGTFGGSDNLSALTLDEAWKKYFQCNYYCRHSFCSASWPHRKINIFCGPHLIVQIVNLIYDDFVRSGSI